MHAISAIMTIPLLHTDSSDQHVIDYVTVNLSFFCNFSNVSKTRPISWLLEKVSSGSTDSTLCANLSVHFGLT